MQIRRPDRRRMTSSSGASISRVAVRWRPAALEGVLEHLGLRDRAREAIEQEAVGGLAAVDALHDHLADQVVRDEVALLHVLLGLLADRGLLLDREAQDVAGGVVGQVEIVDEALGLGALAGAGRAEEDEVHLGHGNPAGYLLRACGFPQTPSDDRADADRPDGVPADGAEGSAETGRRGRSRRAPRDRPELAAALEGLRAGPGGAGAHVAPPGGQGGPPGLSAGGHFEGQAGRLQHALARTTEPDRAPPSDDRVRSTGRPSA